MDRHEVNSACVQMHTHTHTLSLSLFLSLSLSLFGSDGVKCAGYSPNSFKLSGSVPTCCLSKANFPGCTIHFFLGVCHCSSSNGKTGRQWGQFSLFPWQLLTGLTVLPLQDQKWEQLLFTFDSTSKTGKLDLGMLDCRQVYFSLSDVVSVNVSSSRASTWLSSEIRLSWQVELLQKGIVFLEGLATSAEMTESERVLRWMPAGMAGVPEVATEVPHGSRFPDSKQT